MKINHSIILFVICLGSSLQSADNPTVSFKNDVLPILTRAGCSAGSCHSKSGGQNGFGLSIFSFDPDSDYHEIVFDARGRRIFPAAPENSLLLLKATNTIFGHKCNLLWIKLIIMTLLPKQYNSLFLVVLRMETLHFHLVVEL